MTKLFRHVHTLLTSHVFPLSVVKHNLTIACKTLFCNIKLGNAIQHTAFLPYTVTAGRPHPGDYCLCFAVCSFAVLGYLTRDLFTF